MNLHMENKYLPITVSSLSRVITNSILVSIFNMDLWGFTLSRIIGTSVYISYIFSLGFFKYKLNFNLFIPKDFTSLVFQKFTKNGINSSYLREIYSQFIKLNLLNFILMKCQNLILSFILKCSSEEKSDYSFISQNYSLISRFLFDPIIDAFYNLVNRIKYINQDNYIKDIDNNKENILTNNDKFYEQTIEKNKIIEKKQSQIKMNEKNNNNILSEGNNKEINYVISIKLFQLFLKIFTFIGTLMIPYYLLIGTEFMGLIYGQKWQTNNIDKIGACYSFYLIFSSILDLVKSLGNATNDSNQMNLVYLSLIINSFILSTFMFIFSKWDICGLIIANVISSLFLINSNLYIIFCGRNNHQINNFKKNSSLFSDIKNYLEKCFITNNSFITTTIFIVIGYFFKNYILLEKSAFIKILTVILIGLINICFFYFFEHRKICIHFNSIKIYK